MIINKWIEIIKKDKSLIELVPEELKEQVLLSVEILDLSKIPENLRTTEFMQQNFNKSIQTSTYFGILNIENFPEYINDENILIIAENYPKIDHEKIPEQFLTKEFLTVNLISKLKNIDCEYDYIYSNAEDICSSIPAEIKCQELYLQICSLSNEYIDFVPERFLTQEFYIELLLNKDCDPWVYGKVSWSTDLINKFLDNDFKHHIYYFMESKRKSFLTEEQMIQGFKHNWSLVTEIPTELLVKHKDVIIEKIKEQPATYHYLKDKLWQDNELIECFLTHSQSWDSLQQIPKDNLFSEKLCILAVNNNIKNLKFVPKEILDKVVEGITIG